MSYADALDFGGDDWPFCECGVTLLDGEDECPTCAQSPHGRDCDCHECVDYWDQIAAESKAAADRANRALVCSCGWTGAFIEHHNSTAYGATPRAGCVVRYRASRTGRWTRVAPEGLRWATGGGSAIGECNGYHLARIDRSGTLCGRYGPATPTDPGGGKAICGNCARIAKVPRTLLTVGADGEPTSQAPDRGQSGASQ